MGSRESAEDKKNISTDFAGEAVATRDAYGTALAELGRKNSRVVALDADLSCSTKTNKFAKAFPERFFNIGISEQDMVGTACGLSLAGKIPFASTFAVFATGRAWEQLRQSVCYSNLNVKIAATHGGLTVGEDGASHQSLEDIAITRALPNMTVIVPADGYETVQAINAAAEYEGPVYIRLGRAKVPAVMPADYKFKIGRAHVFSLGRDVTIIATGIMVAEALAAKELLSKEGIDAGVINMACIKPLDKEAVISAAKASRLIITAEEHSVIGGLGGAVAECLSENCPKPLIRIGTNDTFGCSGTPKELLKLFKLTAADIAEKARKFLTEG
ncbi:MAG: transketolase family protein [Nitrospiraceae bacterium]|nr:transketolase family protein [Nitrospiraceae bacterium]